MENLTYTPIHHFLPSHSHHQYIQRFYDLSYSLCNKNQVHNIYCMVLVPYQMMMSRLQKQYIPKKLLQRHYRFFFFFLCPGQTKACLLILLLFLKAGMLYILMGEIQHYLKHNLCNQISLSNL